MYFLYTSDWGIEPRYYFTLEAARIGRAKMASLAAYTDCDISIYHLVDPDTLIELCTKEAA